MKITIPGNVSTRGNKDHDPLRNLDVMTQTGVVGMLAYFMALVFPLDNTTTGVAIFPHLIMISSTLVHLDNVWKMTIDNDNENEKITVRMWDREILNKEFVVTPKTAMELVAVAKSHHVIIEREHSSKKLNMLVVMEH